MVSALNAETAFLRLSPSVFQPWARAARTGEKLPARGQLPATAGGKVRKGRPPQAVPGQRQDARAGNRARRAPAPLLGCSFCTFLWSLPFRADPAARPLQRPPGRGPSRGAPALVQPAPLDRPRSRAPALQAEWLEAGPTASRAPPEPVRLDRPPAREFNQSHLEASPPLYSIVSAVAGGGGRRGCGAQSRRQLQPVRDPQGAFARPPAHPRGPSRSASPTEVEHVNAARDASAGITRRRGKRSEWVGGGCVI